MRSFAVLALVGFVVGALAALGTAPPQPSGAVMTASHRQAAPAAQAVAVPAERGERPSTARDRAPAQSSPAIPASPAIPVPDPAVDALVPDRREPPCAPASLPERAGQVLVVGLPGASSPQDPVVGEVLEVGVGGVLVIGHSVQGAHQVRELIGALQAGSRLPLLVATDEEGGRVSSFRDVFGTTPSARALAAAGGAGATRRAAARIGERLTELGVTVNLAPVVDLDAGPSRAVIGDRSFSADAAVTAAHGLAFARGLAAGGVTPTAKHFPGHGSQADTHVRGSVDDTVLAELVRTDLVPFEAQIAAGAPIVMLGHVTYTALDPDRPASMSPAAYGLLRDMGFRGVAITDSIGMGAVHRRWSYEEAAVMAVRAGADAVLATDGWVAAAMRDALVDAVKQGRLDEARLDEAAARMLAVKGVDPGTLTCTAVAVPR